MDLPDVRATWDDGSFDKDIPGWVESLVHLTQDGPLVVMERAGSRETGLIQEVLPLTRRVLIAFTGGMRWFSLGARRLIVDPQDLTMRAPLRADLADRTLHAALPRAVAAAMATVGPVPEVTDEPFDPATAQPYRDHLRVERRWGEGTSAIWCVVDIQPDGRVTWASSRNDAEWREPFVALSVQADASLLLHARLPTGRQEAALAALRAVLAPWLGDAWLEETS